MFAISLMLLLHLVQYFPCGGMPKYRPLILLSLWADMRNRVILRSPLLNFLKNNLKYFLYFAYTKGFSMLKFHLHLALLLSKMTL